MLHAKEQGLVEQLVAHAAVVASDVAVMHRFAPRDVMPLHADLAAPGEIGIGCELRAIITDDHARLAAFGDEIGQVPHEPASCDQAIRHRTQALPGHVIDDVQDPEPRA